MRVATAVSDALQANPTTGRRFSMRQQGYAAARPVTGAPTARFQPHPAPSLDTNTKLERLVLHEHIFGSVCFKHPGADNQFFTLSVSNLVEVRGDGLRTSVGGRGRTAEDAVNQMWDEITKPGMFLTVSEFGRDEDYIWNGKLFIPYVR